MSAADFAIEAGSAAARRHAPRRTTGVAPLIGALCIGVMAIMLFPLIMCFSASIKTAQEASAVPPHYWPGALSIENYLKVFHYQAGLPVYLGNSFAVAALTIALCLGLGTPAAYGLARFPVPAKELVFLVLLSGLMIPYQALLTPLYIMAASLGLANTYLGLAIVHTVVQLPFSIYLLRNSFEETPRELEEAGVIDGCNSVQLLRWIFLPAAAPAIVTVTLFAFITSWNEFLAALIFMNKETAFTVPIMLVGVRQGHFGAIDWGALQAGVVVSILPCLAIYLLLQRYYVSGFLSGAIK
ncbi:MAG TPA: carbohydrate ABC transporter permease [Roseiarcus sp.]|nr:carbohydrate ABC transporter permease [Roseiarcus sp.]